MDDSSPPTNPTACPVCGALVAPDGLCPRCLLADAAQPTSPHNSEAPALAEVAAAFPQFEIVELIGQGGMGTVWRARQPKLDRHIALKLLPASLAERDPAFAERFDREGQLLARLHHPNIVVVHDSGRAGSFFYLVMELVDGVNLRQAMRAGRFTPAQALAIVPRICDALQYAHEEGVLHRDIKPENILLDAKGRVKLADFGIAKLMAQPEAAPSGAAPAAGALTHADATLGTPNYMAPEQFAQPGEVDHRADIYSLGVVFYELLTGELPLGKFAPPSGKSGADPRLDGIVQQALERERQRRQQSAGELRTQVESLAGAPPPLLKPSNWLSGLATFFAWSSGLLGTAAWFQLSGSSRILVLLVLVSALLGVLLGFLSRRTWIGKHALIIGGLNLLIWIGAALTFTSSSPQEVPRVPQSAHVEGPSSVLALYNEDELDYVFYYAGRFTSTSNGSQNLHSQSWMEEGSIILPSGKTFGFHRESVNPQMLRVNGRDYTLPSGRVFLLHDDGSLECFALFPRLIIAIDPKALGELVAANPWASDRTYWTSKMPSVQLTKAADALEKLQNKVAALRNQKGDANELRATREKRETLDAELERAKAAWYKFELVLTRHETTGLEPGEYGRAQREMGKAEVRLRVVQAMAEDAAAGAAFGPVTERLVPANDQGPWAWFDIDSGRDVVSLHGDNNDHADFAAIMTPHPGLSTANETGCGSVPLEPAAWDAMTPAQLMEKLHEATVDGFYGDEPPPRTYGFTTRGGNFGLLQIIGESTAPRGLQIRWKSLQGPSVGESSQARRTRVEKELLQRIGEHLSGDTGPDGERVDYRGLMIDVSADLRTANILIDAPKPRLTSRRRAMWSGVARGELGASDEGGGVWVVSGRDPLGALQFKVHVAEGVLPSR